MSNEHETRREAISDSHPFYSMRTEYPSLKPSATIYFDGIMAMCFDGDRECTVGVNNKATTHKLRFGVWRNQDCRQISDGIPPHAREIEINVKKPAQSGVQVYAPPSGFSPGNDRHSFVDYCLDLEGPEFHGAPLTKKADVLWPRFHINNGLFSTYKLTKSQFAIKRANQSRDIGSVGLGITADIFLAPGGAIEFLVAGEETPFLTLPKIKRETYEIAITNNCFDCDYDVASDDPTKRSDFHLHYEAIDLAPDERFELVNTCPDLPKCPPVTLGSCIGPSLRRHILQCDTAPCCVAIFGRTGTLSSSA